MSKENQIIIVDESGDATLPIDHTTRSIYTIAAILIDGDHIDQFRESAKRIVQTHAQTGELKSSNIAQNISRRHRILSEIAEAKFSFYCLVVDKQQIAKDSGLRYKPSFYKFLHKMFYSRIHQALLGMDIISDPFGSTEFMDSFINYLRSKGGLFVNINFTPSSKEPLLQIADVVAGSIRRVYENLDSIESLQLLGYPKIPIEEWPPNIVRFSDFPASTEKDKFDGLIRQIALNVARDFVQKHIDDADSEMQGLAEGARFLLYNYHVDPTQYVLKYKLIKHLKEIGVRNSPRALLSKLRDHDLIICATERGVKLPFNSKDIHLWIDRVNSQVVPYLKRLEKARNDILIASKNDYDILNQDIFPDLANYLLYKKNV